MRAWALSSSTARKAAASTRAATTARQPTPQSASRPVSVASSSCRTMFAPRRALPIWSGSSSATRACPMTGSMATVLESREFAGEKAELEYEQALEKREIGLAENQQNPVGDHILDSDRKRKCAVARDHASRKATSGSTRLALRAGK